MPLAGSNHHVTPLHLGMRHSNQVQCTPSPWRKFLPLLVVVLQRTDPGSHPGWLDLHLVADPQNPVGQHAGNHRSGPSGGKRPVDPETGPPPVLRCGYRRQQIIERPSQFIKA